jgi:hypothetical protein
MWSPFANAPTRRMPDVRSAEVSGGSALADSNRRQRLLHGARIVTTRPPKIKENGVQMHSFRAPSPRRTGGAVSTCSISAESGRRTRPAGRKRKTSRTPESSHGESDGGADGRQAATSARWTGSRDGSVTLRRKSPVSLCPNRAAAGSRGNRQRDIASLNRASRCRASSRRCSRTGASRSAPRRSRRSRPACRPARGRSIPSSPGS